MTTHTSLEDICVRIEVELLKKIIYYVRHGESKANLTKEFSYKLIDYPLTKKGRLQAHQTAEYFKNKSIQCIFSSPLKRTVETAKIIATQFNLKVIIVENFREINVGSLEQKGFNENDWKKYFEIKNEWREGKYNARFPEGENYIMLLKRMKKGIREVLENNYENNIIVGHGGIFVTTVRDICADVNINNFSSANCSITKLVVTQNENIQEIRILSWGTTTHLHGEAADLVPGVPILEKKSTNNT